MAESKIFFRLTQVTNTYKHISRNIGAIMIASRTLAHDNVFKKKNSQEGLCIAIKNIYSSKSLHWYQWISVWKKVHDESFLHDKVCVKKPSFAKEAVSSLKMSELEILLRLTQAPNTSMQIFRNKGATKKASRKMINDRVFKTFGKKAIFYHKMVAPPKQIISHNSVHWYQCISLWKMLGGEY